MKFIFSKTICYLDLKFDIRHVCVECSLVRAGSECQSGSEVKWDAWTVGGCCGTLLQNFWYVREKPFTPPLACMLLTDISRTMRVSFVFCRAIEYHCWPHWAKTLVRKERHEHLHLSVERGNQTRWEYEMRLLAI